jgi:glycerophosphoryl diester phosphodiesterase
MNTTVLILPLVVGVLQLMVAGAETGRSPAEEVLGLKRTVVIAHRGYSAIAPENTIPAFELALAAGADLVELDYYHSKDGELVVIHDGTLDRTTDADEREGGTKIAVKEKNASELKDLDAGKWFKPGFAGTKVPTLNESLDFIQAKGMTLIERKAGDAGACVKLLREKKLVNQLIVQAFDWEYLKDFHKQEPAQVLGALGPSANYEGKKLTDAEKVLSPLWVDRAKATGSKAVVWNKNITAEAVQHAHKQGLKVWVYTINDAALANQLLDLGIDGIISDNPAVIWKALALRAAK